jgi:hypothetical protein
MNTSIKGVLISTIALLLPFSCAVFAQSQTLAATMDVYVFPSSGQDSSQQSTDESECYNWAVSNVGTDPFELAKQDQANAEQAQAEQQAAAQAGKGSAARGAVRGAAAGAVIGEIANDDAGKGAAWGAAAGAVRGRRRGHQAEAQASQQAAAQQESRTMATESELTNFKNAFSVCLEAKEYMVKY